MTAIQTRDEQARTWQASRSDYEATACRMERHGFPELAREWWAKSDTASGSPARAASCPDVWLGAQKGKCVLCDEEINVARVARLAGIARTGNIRQPAVWLCHGCMAELRKATTVHRMVKMRAQSRKKSVESPSVKPKPAQPKPAQEPVKG